MGATPQAVLSALASQNLDGCASQQMLLLDVYYVATCLAQATADAFVVQDHRGEEAAGFDGVARLLGTPEVAGKRLGLAR